MSNLAVFSNLLSPQLKVIESAESSRVLPLQSFTHIYLFGVSIQGEEYVPTIIGSVKDFESKFGRPTTEFEARLTYNCVTLIFKNDPSAKLYFTSVGETSFIGEGFPSRYVRAVNQLTIEDEYPGGFLLAPNAFRYLGDEQRIETGNAMIAKAEQLDMMALLDAHGELYTEEAEVLTPAILLEDADKYQASATGHYAYYGSYLELDSGGNSPSSPAVAAVATARFKREGYKPPAGLKYPLKGVLKPLVEFSQAARGVLDTNGINVVRKIRNQGTVIWGMRTRQTALLYRYFHYRVIANVVNRTFRQSIDLKRQLFDLIDGQGELFSYLEDAANSVGRQLYQSGMLFGASENDAFAAKCDFENNTPEMIQQGYVYVEFTYSIAPAVDKMVINSRLANIGSVAESNESGTVA